MYTVKNYWTEETIAIYPDFDDAKRLAELQDGFCVVTDSGEWLYCNVEIPF